MRNVRKRLTTKMHLGIKIWPDLLEQAKQSTVQRGISSENCSVGKNDSKKGKFSPKLKGLAIKKILETFIGRLMKLRKVTVSSPYCAKIRVGRF